MVRSAAAPRVSIQVAHAAIRGRPSPETPHADAVNGAVARQPAKENRVLAMRRTHRHIVAAMRSGAFVLSERRGGEAVVMMFP